MLGIGLMFCVALPSLVRAVDSKTWPFDDPLKYEYSNVRDIEVADSQARLRLRGKGNVVADKWTYATNSSALANVAFGADVSLILEPRAGNTFAPTGSFVSRTLDGGGFGNLWKRWGATVYNSPLKNAWGELSPGSAGLVALFHFNNEGWKEALSGAIGTPRVTGRRSARKPSWAHIPSSLTLNMVPRSDGICRFLSRTRSLLHAGSRSPTPKAGDFRAYCRSSLAAELHGDSYRRRLR